MRRLLPGVLFVAMIGILAVLSNRGESPLTASGTASQFIVTQSSTPTNAAPGGVIAYTVTTTNPSTATVTRIVTSPFVPAGLIYLPDRSNPHCSLSNGVVYCRSDDNQNGYTLGPGASKSFVVSYQVPSSQPCATITHSVAAQSLQTSPAPPSAVWSRALTAMTCDGSSSSAPPASSSAPTSSAQSSSSSAVSSVVSSTSSNHSASSTPSCPPSAEGRSITFEAAPRTVENGGNPVYIVRVCNSGTETIPGSIRTYTPQGLAFLPLNSDRDCYQDKDDTNLIYCTGTELAPGASKSYRLSYGVQRSSVCPTTIDYEVASITRKKSKLMNCMYEDDVQICYVPGFGGAYKINGLWYWGRSNTGGYAPVESPHPWSGAYENPLSATTRTEVCCASSSPGSSSSMTSLAQSENLIVAYNGPPVTALPGGDFVTYAIALHNPGSRTAYDVILAASISAGLTFNPHLSGRGCSLNQGFVTCWDPSGTGLAIGPGETKIIRIGYELPRSLACTSMEHQVMLYRSGGSQQPITARLTASVGCMSSSSSSAPAVCPRPSSSSRSSASIPSSAASSASSRSSSSAVPSSAASSVASQASSARSSAASAASSSLAALMDLDIWLDRPVFAERGGMLTFTIWLRNKGTQDLTDAVVSTSLPARAQFLPQASDSCWSTAVDFLTCHANIPAGGWRSFQVSFLVSSSHACPAFMPLYAKLQKSQQSVRISCTPSGQDLLCRSPDFNYPALRRTTDSATRWYWVVEGDLYRITSPGLISLLKHCSVNDCSKSAVPLIWFVNDDTIVTCSSVSSSSSSAVSSPPTPPTKSLTLSLSAPESAERNGIATFTLTATNDGSVGYTHYSIAAMNDAKTIFLPERSDPNCSAATNATVLCDGHNFDRGFALLPGESKSFQVSYLIPKTVPCESSLPYSMTGGDNDVPSATTTVTCSASAHADIALSYASPPSSVPQGGTATYTVTARNIGNIAAEEVVIGAYTNNLLTYLPAQSSPYCTQKSGDHYVYCRETANAGFRLLPGDSRSFDLRYSVYPYCTSSRLGHQIFLSQPQSDGNTENNTAEISATMYCSPASSRSSSSRTPSSSSFTSSSSSSSSQRISSSSSSVVRSSSSSSSFSSGNPQSGTATYTTVSVVSCSAAEISALLKIEELIAEKRAHCLSGCFSTTTAPSETLTIYPLCFSRVTATWLCAPSC